MRTICTIRIIINDVKTLSNWFVTFKTSQAFRMPTFTNTFYVGSCQDVIAFGTFW